MPALRPSWNATTWKRVQSVVSQSRWSASATSASHALDTSSIGIIENMPSEVSQGEVIEKDASDTQLMFGDDRARLASIQRKKRQLVRKQLEVERQSFKVALEKYRQDADKAVHRGDASVLRPANDLLLSWLWPLTLCIQKDLARDGTVRSKSPPSVHAEARKHLKLLPANHLAVIVAHEVLGATLRDPDGAALGRLALSVGRAVQSEVNARTIRFLRGENRANRRLRNRKSKNAGEGSDTGLSGATNTKEVPKRREESPVSAVEFAALRAKLYDAQWNDRTLLVVGSSLINAMSKTAFIENTSTRDGEQRFVPAIEHTTRRMRSHRYKTIGVLKCHDLVFDKAIEADIDTQVLISPKRQPMLVRPIPWSNPKRGAYLQAQEHLIRTPPSPQLLEALSQADISQIYRGLNALGENRWRVNEKILSTAKSLWERSGGIAGLVEKKDLPMPSEPTLLSDVTEQEKSQQRRMYRRERVRIRKINRERHSLRCDVAYKIENAEEFQNYDELYLPHNLDFRGRAYPIPVHLQHMGADLTRAMLTFAGPGKELGARGVYWLKVHLANLLGADKLAFDDRVLYTENRLDQCLKTADDPLSDESLEFWATQRDPFQLLAACNELRQGCGRFGSRRALETFQSTLPIAMDGSCNGLQHYAALGRDAYGGEQVNLVPGDTPRDVYAEVAARVAKQVEVDAAGGDEIAKLLVGKVSRRVVKQTVMTSVYGVTVVGAREQIKNKLRELGLAVKENGEPARDELFAMSFYLARLTLASLGVVFEGATKIMEWLGTTARRVGATGREVQWVTPLGLPVIQPYRAQNQNMIKTVVQRVKLESREDHMPVSPRRQASAFAPNYVHSVDSSHMLMTAALARERGINFAAVHDSFWTNAASVDEMNSTLRQTFVTLHERELLAELREHFLLTYPGLKLPPIPQRGVLELRDVIKSQYFFS